MISDAKQKAEYFNKYFNEILTLNTENAPNLDFNEIINHSEFELNDITVTDEEVSDQQIRHLGMTIYFLTY